MAGSPYGIRADLHVLAGSRLDRNSRIEIAGADGRHRVPKQGGQLQREHCPKLSLSSQPSSKKETIVREPAMGSQCSRSARGFPSLRGKRGRTVASAVLEGVGF